MDLRGVGPFDSDTAADYLSDLYSAEYHQRLGLIEAALRTGADPSEGFLDSHEAVPAIVAAAIVAQFRAAEPGDIPEPLAFLAASGVPPIPDSLIPLAVAALERILAPDSELNELWSATDQYRAWEDTILTLRAALGDDPLGASTK
ncbi:DUF4259 domain-containing protein [Streptomycetaceae bacterium NBC_01309]